MRMKCVLIVLLSLSSLSGYASESKFPHKLRSEASKENKLGALLVTVGCLTLPFFFLGVMPLSFGIDELRDARHLKREAKIIESAHILVNRNSGHYSSKDIAKADATFIQFLKKLNEIYEYSMLSPETVMQTLDDVYQTGVEKAMFKAIYRKPVANPMAWQDHLDGVANTLFQNGDLKWFGNYLSQHEEKLNAELEISKKKEKYRKAQDQMIKDYYLLNQPTPQGG